MATKNLSSENVDVFPCVGRRISTKRSARLVSEKMLTSLVNNLLDRNSFVISFDSTDNKNIVQFNLYGYFFSVTLGDISALLGKNAEKVYASITLLNTDAFLQINGQDEKPQGGSEYIYTGLLLSDTEQESPSVTGGELHSILLLKKTGNTWDVPQDSYVKYTIDGGVLD